MKTDGGAGQLPSLEGYEIIRRYFLAYYRPTSRRGMSVYSAALGREVRMSEATAGAPKHLIDALSKASDAPQYPDGSGVKTHCLPSFFNTWSKSAWVDILNDLTDVVAEGRRVKASGW